MTTLWIVFNTVIVILLTLDLAVVGRRSHVIRLKEALLMSAVWISLALLFAGGLALWGLPEHDPAHRHEIALQFVAGYLVEQSLSVDNLFVFLLIFSYFRVPKEYQHKVLFWGILGAIVMRALFILTGVALFRKFHFILYIFGAFLIYAGFKMIFQGEKEVEPEKNPVLRLFRRHAPMTESYVDGRFWVRRAGRWLATPLFAVLLAVESTDLLFAVDSIPAVLAVTQDPFIAYSSNIFAVLGLRSLYFALAGVIGVFKYLNYGLAAVLMFVGAKLVLQDFWHIPTPWALAVIALLLVLSVLVSVVAGRWVRAESQEGG